MLSIHSGILQKHQTGIFTVLHVNELSLPLHFSFSLGNADIFPFSKHSIKCCLIFVTSYIILVLKESRAKQNYHIRNCKTPTINFFQRSRSALIPHQTHQLFFLFLGLHIHTYMHFCSQNMITGCG